MNNDMLWAKTLEEEKPIIRSPDRYDKTCIRFNQCTKPETCRVRIKEKRMREQGTL